MNSIANINFRRKHLRFITPSVPFAERRIIGMKKVLCKPCAVETAARKDREVKQLPGRSEKITCDKCGRRRYGLPYEVKRVFFTGGSRK